MYHTLETCSRYHIYIPYAAGIPYILDTTACYNVIRMNSKEHVVPPNVSYRAYPRGAYPEQQGLLGAIRGLFIGD